MLEMAYNTSLYIIDNHPNSPKDPEANSRYFYTGCTYTFSKLMWKVRV
jgi:hypothetical protein